MTREAQAENHFPQATKNVSDIQLLGEVLSMPLWRLSTNQCQLSLNRLYGMATCDFLMKMAQMKTGLAFPYLHTMFYFKLYVRNGALSLMCSFITFYHYQIVFCCIFYEYSFLVLPLLQWLVQVSSTVSISADGMI